MIPKSRIWTRITITSAVVLGPISGGLLANHLLEQKQVTIKQEERFKGIDNLLLKNSYGTPITLPLDGQPLNIKLIDFTETEKQEAISAINDLDEIIDNIDYRIIDSSDKKVKQHIIITNNYKFKKEEMNKTNALGLTVFNHNTSTAKIKYPINIYLNETLKDGYFLDGTKLSSYVIKHEMMHSLGFKDMYEDEYLNKTIMFHNISGKTEVRTYTPFDVLNIKQLYDGINITPKELYKEGLIKVEFPKNNQIYFESNKKQEQNNEDDYSL